MRWGRTFGHLLSLNPRFHAQRNTGVLIRDLERGITGIGLQDPMNVAKVVKFVLMQPEETVIPEVMVLPMRP